MGRLQASDQVPIIIQKLSHSDRIVRQAAIITCSMLKATDSVKKIIHMWRNDPISDVRASAKTALEAIGGQEAETAIYVTGILTDEMGLLAASMRGGPRASIAP
eukprot:GFYU01029804.1.p1 GENE.GFYU01029804.1~~GFYU01029804.1.p1  ORF type:complete len:122 (-),score=19.09 GFYU01029804.1:205-516(-)